MSFHAPRILSRFRGDEYGSVFVEAIVVIPFIMFFAAGILEFGNMFWEKQQIETGLRDGARYLARCHTTSPSYVPNCSEAMAKDIAVFGNPDGTGGPRVPGWSPGEITVTTTTKTASGPPPVTADVIRFETDHSYQTSPLFAMLGLGSLKIVAYHEEPYIGW